MTLSRSPSAASDDQTVTLDVFATDSDDTSNVKAFHFDLQLVGSTPEPTPTLEPTSTPTLEPAPTPTLEPTSTSTLEPTPEPTLEPPSLSAPFADASVHHEATLVLDMADHFSGDGLTYTVMVTTTNQCTGQTNTGPLNSVARNKVTGVWSGAVLTLTGAQDLTLTITAEGANNATASGEFTLSLTAPPEPTQDGSHEMPLWS